MSTNFFKNKTYTNNPNNNNDTPTIYTSFEIEEPKKPNIKTQEQFLKFKQEHDQRDELLLEELHKNAKQIKQGQLLIKNTLQNQEPLLNNIDQDMDKLDSKMVRSNNILANYLEKSSNSCLYWAIGIELLFLFLFFML